MLHIGFKLNIFGYFVGATVAENPGRICGHRDTLSFVINHHFILHLLSQLQLLNFMRSSFSNFGKIKI
jgi:hypothetical protein